MVKLLRVLIELKGLRTGNENPSFYINDEIKLNPSPFVKDENRVKTLYDSNYIESITFHLYKNSLEVYLDFKHKPAEKGNREQSGFYAGNVLIYRAPIEL